MSSLTSATVAPTFIPALPPPLGITPRPDNPPSLEEVCHVTVGICVSIITIVFFLRLYSRVIITRKKWLFEDCECLVRNDSSTSLIYHTDLTTLAWVRVPVSKKFAVS